MFGLSCPFDVDGGAFLTLLVSLRARLPPLLDALHSALPGLHAVCVSPSRSEPSIVEWEWQHAVQMMEFEKRLPSPDAASSDISSGSSFARQLDATETSSLLSHHDRARRLDLEWWAQCPPLPEGVAQYAKPAVQGSGANTAPAIFDALGISSGVWPLLHLATAGAAQAPMATSIAALAALTLFIACVVGGVRAVRRRGCADCDVLASLQPVPLEWEDDGRTVAEGATVGEEWHGAPAAARPPLTVGRVATAFQSP